jgi:hypothetical protein
LATALPLVALRPIPDSEWAKTATPVLPFALTSTPNVSDAILTFVCGPLAQIAGRPSEPLVAEIGDSQQYEPNELGPNCSAALAIA